VNLLADHLADLKVRMRSANFCHFFSLALVFYARKQLLLSARLSHRNSVGPSVRLSVTRVDQSKTV